MRVNLSTISIQASLANDAAYSPLAQWSSHRVRWIKQTVAYVQNSFWASAILLSGISIVFFNIALSACRLVHYFLNKNAPYETLSQTERLWRSIELGSIFFATWGGGIGVFCKSLQLPLSIGYVILISMTTSLIYLAVKTK